MASIDLLARVIRNSDFTDYDVKGPATKLVLESWCKIILIVLGELREILEVVGSTSEEDLSDQDLEAINYLMRKMIFGASGAAIVEQMSSPSMVDTLHSLSELDNFSTGEAMYTLFLMEDINEVGWQDLWKNMIANPKTGGFVLECLIERLWRIAHSKALDANQSMRVVGIVEEIEARLDWTNERKSAILQEFRDAATLASIKEGEAPR